jgi:hypothetical protein
MIRLVMIVLLLSQTATAIADSEPVREDIVDIRHQREPQRRVVLGWTKDNRIAVHVAHCPETGGEARCPVWFEVTAGRKTTRTDLFYADCLKCEGGDGIPWAVPTELASKAIRAERAAIDALGPLQPSAEGPKPKVEVRMIDDECRVDLVIGKKTLRGVIQESSCLPKGGNISYWGAEFYSVEVSPDRSRLAVTIRMRTRAEEYFSDWDKVVIVDAQ